MSASIEPLVKGIFTPKLFNNLFACCSMVNVFLLLLHATQWGETIVFPLIVFKIVIFLFFRFFLHHKQYILSIHIIYEVNNLQYFNRFFLLKCSIIIITITNTTICTTTRKSKSLLSIVPEAGFFTYVSQLV